MSHVTSPDRLRRSVCSNGLGMPKARPAATHTPRLPATSSSGATREGLSAGRLNARAPTRMGCGTSDLTLPAALRLLRRLAPCHTIRYHTIPYHTIPHVTTRYHTLLTPLPHVTSPLPHVTTRNHTPPHATTRYHTPTTRYHKLPHVTTPLPHPYHTLTTPLPHPYPIPSHPISSHPIPSHHIPSHPTQSTHPPIPSHLIPSHHTPSHRIPFHQPAHPPTHLPTHPPANSTT